jgi:hypothetical protein
MPLKLDLSTLLEYPEAWRQRGKGLLCSSGVLWRHAHHSTPEALSMPAASLLGGYALENLLKGLRVKQLRAAGESIFVKGLLRRELTQHDLLRLADAARCAVGSPRAVFAGATDRHNHVGWALRCSARGTPPHLRALSGSQVLERVGGYGGSNKLLSIERDLVQLETDIRNERHC